MPIAASDLLFKLSVKTGSAGNSTAQGDPNASLGKYISTTQVTDNTLNNLFDNVTGEENAASDVEYRCIFIHNAHGSLSLTSPKVWISAEVSGGASVAIAVDSNVAASAIGSSSAQATEIADESTAPSPALSFSSPTTQGTGLSVGDIAAGFCKAIWIRRTAANTSPKNNDGCTISIAGDTAE